MVASPLKPLLGGFVERELAAVHLGEELPVAHLVGHQAILDELRGYGRLHGLGRRLQGGRLVALSRLDGGADVYDVVGGSLRIRHQRAPGVP